MDDTYLPQNSGTINLVSFSINTQPGRTYKLYIENGRINGFTDDVDALIQTIYIILSVERYKYAIYSRNYGIELMDLIGKPKDYVMSELKRRITEALSQDDRIESVDEFRFEYNRKSLLAVFVVHTVYGDITTQTEVML